MRRTRAIHHRQSGGTVTDRSGSVVPGARVALRNIETGFALNTTTGDDGAFLFPRLPIGGYELTADKTGFSTYLQKGIQLTVNQIAIQTIMLEVGKVAETTTVKANADLVETRSGTVGQLVDKEKITELPLNGRLAQRLVFLSAGTVDLGRNGCRICGNGGVYPNEQTAGVNGAGMGQVNYQLDGVGHNDTYLNVNVPFPNPDAIQEFNLQANNFTAEYGNAGGGIVNIVTRSGTNQLQDRHLSSCAMARLTRELLRAHAGHTEAESVRRQRRRANPQGQALLLRDLPGHARHQRGFRKRQICSHRSGAHRGLLGQQAAHRSRYQPADPRKPDSVQSPRSGIAVLSEAHPAAQRPWPSS